jgi:hypothetical protein
MQPSKSSAPKKLLKVVFYAALIALPILLWVYRFDVYDWWQLRNYSPPADIQAIAQHTTMNEGATRTFYANHPQLDNSEELSKNCHETEFTIVLGCYIQGKGIFLFNVTDSRLNGVEEVTGAHEMLHAAYDRLSTSERKKVDQMVNQAFTQVTDERVKATIEQYRKRDPSIVPNELHSILGTEVRNLPPELETYYHKYFVNRLAIVGFSEQYENEFSSRQTKVKEYDSQLTALKKQIEHNQAELDVTSAELQARRAQLDAQKDAGNYQEYNAGVAAFNNKVDNYNQSARETTQLIEKYNLLVIQRNALALEVNDLAKAIDSRPKGISAQ